HQMGTCRMGSDPKISVVNRFGECHEVKGLYLADSSIFPASAGINPMLPIMALAEQIASHLVGRKIK
ncbi:MAG: GMC family oxidoreductase, partial [Anaerolineae bacterium]|nr:GMC family oxidoreductase [Anaerolineae bacterium]